MITFFNEVMEILRTVKTLNLAKMKTRPTVFCSQYKCILNQYLVSCSIGVYLFVKATFSLSVHCIMIS